MNVYVLFLFYRNLVKYKLDFIHIASLNLEFYLIMQIITWTYFNDIDTFSMYQREQNQVGQNTVFKWERLQFGIDKAQELQVSFLAGLVICCVYP